MIESSALPQCIEVRTYPIPPLLERNHSDMKLFLWFRCIPSCWNHFWSSVFYDHFSVYALTCEPLSTRLEKRGTWKRFVINQIFLGHIEPKIFIINSDQFQTFFDLRTYGWRKTPRTNILKGLFRHIYIEKGQIKWWWGGMQRHFQVWPY